MTEVDEDTVKPGAYVWVRTIELVEQVEEEVAMLSPFICQEMNAGGGASKSDPITLPWRVTPSGLSMVLEYCRFHIVPGRTKKDKKSFDDRYYKMDPKKICEVSSAATSLQLKALVDLTSDALTKVIEEKFRKRGMINDDDLSEEEKLEPIRNSMDDPRIRRLNILHARRRKDLKERESSKSVEVEVEHSDQRSVDDLLSFINGDNHDTKVSQTPKSKKKNHKRKDNNKVSPSSPCAPASPSSIIAADEGRKASHGSDSIADECSMPGNSVRNDGKPAKSQDTYDDSLAVEDDLDDFDSDDGIDPALKEAIDREVEDFARRLNSDWSERIKEILSHGQEQRPLHHTVS